MAKLVAILAVAFVQTACVSKMISKVLPQEGKEPEKVEQVKKVAVVAYDTIEYKPAGLASRAVPLLGTAQMAANTEAVETELSLQLYNDLVAELKRKKFKVVPLKKVRVRLL